MASIKGSDGALSIAIPLLLHPESGAAGLERNGFD
jgi:hypothetical protein